MDMPEPRKWVQKIDTIKDLDDWDERMEAARSFITLKLQMKDYDSANII